MKTYTCKKCSAEFESKGTYMNHTRWAHVDQTAYLEKYKTYSKEKAERAAQTRFGKDIKVKTNCATCEKEIEIIWREKSKLYGKHFCSHECRYKRDPLSEEQKEKIKYSINELWKDSDFVMRYLDRMSKITVKPVWRSRPEIEICDHFINKFPEHEWTWGGGIYYGEKRLLRDLYSNKLKVCVEYDGIWHFKNINGQLEDKHIKDRVLEDWCMSNGFRLIRIGYDATLTISEIEEIILNTKAPIIKIGALYY